MVILNFGTLWEEGGKNRLCIGVIGTEVEDHVRFTKQKRTSRLSGILFKIYRLSLNDFLCSICPRISCTKTVTIPFYRYKTEYGLSLSL